MITIYSNMPIETHLKIGVNDHSIFLAGPTPRSKEIESWRPTAIQFLEELGYTGQVIIPERQVSAEHIDYDDQVEWELYGLEHCRNIVFWVPRKMPEMPALTTNVEFGLFVKSGKVFYGRPDNAYKCRYLDHLYQKYNPTKIIFNDLNKVLEAVTFGSCKK